MKRIEGLHFAVSPETAGMLKARRLELGWTLKQAGDACGYSAEMIRLLEAARRAPKVYGAEDIVKAYGLEGEDAERLMRESVPLGLIFDRLKSGASRVEDTVINRTNPGSIVDQNPVTGEWSVRSPKVKRKATEVNPAAPQP